MKKVFAVVFGAVGITYFTGKVCLLLADWLEGKKEFPTFQKGFKLVAKFERSLENKLLNLCIDGYQPVFHFVLKRVPVSGETMSNILMVVSIVNNVNGFMSIVKLDPVTLGIVAVINVQTKSIKVAFVQAEQELLLEAGNNNLSAEEVIVEGMPVGE